MVFAQSLATAITVGEVEHHSGVFAAAAGKTSSLGQSLVEATAASAVYGAFWAEFVLRWDSVAKAVDVVDATAEAVASAIVGVGVVALWESALDGGGWVALFVSDGGHVTALDVGAGLAEAGEDRCWGNFAASALVGLSVHGVEHLLGSGKAGKSGDGDELHVKCV